MKLFDVLTVSVIWRCFQMIEGHWSLWIWTTCICEVWAPSWRTHSRKQSLGSCLVAALSQFDEMSVCHCAAATRWSLVTVTSTDCVRWTEILIFKLRWSVGSQTAMTHYKNESFAHILHFCASFFCAPDKETGHKVVTMSHHCCCVFRVNHCIHTIDKWFPICCCPTRQLFLRWSEIDEDNLNLSTSWKFLDPLPSQIGNIKNVIANKNGGLELGWLWIVVDDNSTRSDNSLGDNSLGGRPRLVTALLLSNGSVRRTGGSYYQYQYCTYSLSSEECWYSE